MKKLVCLILVLAVLAGVAVANLGERRVYPLRPGIKYLFTGSRDPNNFWDDVNDVYILNGMLEVLNINITGDLDINDVNIVGDLILSGLTQGSILFVGADEIISEDTTNLLWNDTTNILTTSALTITGNEINISTSQTPAGPSAIGTQGDICWDSGYFYVAVATNTWKRSQLSTWGIPAENVIYAGEDVVYAAEQVIYP